MNLSDLAGPESPDLGPIGAIAISGLSSDSRTVVPGNLFVALSGTRADGSAFIADAISRGAAAIAAAPGVEVDGAVPGVAAPAAL